MHRLPANNRRDLGRIEDENLIEAFPFWLLDDNDSCESPDQTPDTADIVKAQNDLVLTDERNREDRNELHRKIDAAIRFLPQSHRHRNLRI
jgi:hypothetical protein